MTDNFVDSVHEHDDEMKKYELLHKIDYRGNYKPDFIPKNTNDSNLAKYLYDNFDRMDEIEMKKIAMNCLNINDIKRILLNFELNNFKKEPEQLTLDEFAIEAKKILRRYQSKAGGFLLEDPDWNFYKTSISKYDVRSNEVLFENTINMMDFDDTDTEKYLKKIVERLKIIAKNVKVELRYMKERKNKVVYLLIWCKNIDDKEEPEIGL